MSAPANVLRSDQPEICHQSHDTGFVAERRLERRWRSGLKETSDTVEVPTFAMTTEAATEAQSGMLGTFIKWITRTTSSSLYCDTSQPRLMLMAAWRGSVQRYVAVIKGTKQTKLQQSTEMI